MSVVATFNRGSAANRQDGTQVAAGAPRYEAGKYGQAVTIEEATANLIAPTAFGFSAGWNTFSGSSVTGYTTGLAVPEWGATDAVRLQVLGGSNTLKYYASVLTPAANGVTYTNSLWIKNNSTAAITIGMNLSGGASVVNVQPGESRRVTTTAVGNGVSTLQIVFYTAAVGDGIDVTLWHPQSEAKAYATSWTYSVRYIENLSVPVNGLLSAAAGAIECWARELVNTQGYQMPFNLWPFFYAAIATGGTTPRLSWVHPVDGQKQATGLWTIDPTQWHHWVVTWASNQMWLYIDGRLYCTTGVTAFSALPASIDIGSGGVNLNYPWNGFIDDLRISSRTLTAAEIAANYGSAAPAPCIDVTTAKFTFDGGLDGTPTLTRPTPAFLRAAKAAGAEPMTLLAIESINTLKVESSSTSDWQSATYNDGLDTTSVAGDVKLSAFDTAPIADSAAANFNSSLSPLTWQAVGNQTGVSAETPKDVNVARVRIRVYPTAYHTPVYNANYGIGTHIKMWGSMNGGAWQQLDAALYPCYVYFRDSARFPSGSFSGPTLFVPELARTLPTPFYYINQSSNDYWVDVDFYVILTQGKWRFKAELAEIRSYASSDLVVPSVAPPVDARLGARVQMVTVKGWYQTPQTITTKVLDLGVIPTVNSRLEVDDYIPTGTAIAYSASGSNDATAWTSLGAVVDGQSLAPYRYYKISATLTTTAADATPVISSIRILGGDSQFDYYSSHPGQPVQSALPYLTADSFSALTSKIDLTKPATVGELTAKLHWRKKSGDMVATGYLKNKTVIAKLGYVGLAESDFEPFFTGTWHDYQADHEKLILTIKTRSVLKKFTKKIPADDYFLDAKGVKVEGKTYLLQGNIMAVMLLIADLLGVPDRLLNRSTFTDLAAGARSGANWNVKRELDQPEDAQDLLNELAVSAGVIFYEAADGRLNVKLLPTATDTPDDRLDAMQHQFRAVEGGQQDLSTRQAIYYQLLPGKSGGDAKDFAKCYLYINQTAELAWGESSTREWKDKWGLSPYAVQLLAWRWDSWFANPRATVRVDNLPMRFKDLIPGKIVSVDNLRLPCPAASWEGYTVGKTFLITSHTPDPTKRTISLELRELGASNFAADPNFPTYDPMSFFPLVQNLALGQRFQIKEGGGVDVFVDVSFDVPADFHFGAAEIWWKTTGAWNLAGSLPNGGSNQARSFALPATSNTAYTVAVVTVNAAGQRADIATAPQAQLAITPASPPEFPGGSVITPQVIDNNVLLIWPVAAGTFPVAGYEIRRGLTFASAAVIGTAAGTFASLFESVAGTYKYWVVAIDTARVYSGTPLAVYATVNQPPDFVLRDQRTLTWSAGTKTNCVADVDGSLVAPVNATETFQSHFTSHSWAGPQDQVNAGYTVFAQPGMATGQYVETIDYGATIANSKITLDLTRTVTAGSVTLTPTISVSLDNSTWTNYSNVYQAYATNFRYVKITLDFATGNSGVMQISASMLRLDLKQKTLSVSVNLPSTTGDGDQINFSDYGFTFIDVEAIAPGAPFLNDSSKDPVRVIYNFTDAPNPTSFKGLAYDKAGNRVALTGSNKASFIIRGV